MPNEGLIASIQNLAGSFLSIVQTRLELVRVEIEEGRQHLVRLLVLTLFSIFCLCMGVFLLAILLIVLFWDTHRVLVISLLTISFLAAGSVLWMMTLNTLKRMPKMFEASLAELLRDRHHLGG
ncbi:MAG: hypothetical protein CTY33_05260 [Methylotenera sp.]|nr:MAG: hypothetical protein CTY33_05260 [Methylotenera sp.]